MCRPTLFTETPKVKSFHSNSNIYELRGVVISTERSSAALSSLKARLGSVSAPLWLFELVGERRSPCPPIIKFQVTDQSMDVKHRGSHTAHKCLSSYHRSSSFTFAWRTKYGIRSLILQPAIVTSHTQLWGLTRVPLKDRRTRIGGCLFLQHLQSFNTHFRERWRLYSCATSMMNFAKWFRSLNKYIAHSTRQEGPRQWSTLVQLWCLLDSIGIVGR